MYNIGIIGCGKIAQLRHLPEYAARGDVRIAGVYDRNQERGEAVAKNYGAKSYHTYEELLANPEIVAVSVCTANNSHAEISMKALQAGKHVLCEKPMALTREECREMVRAAERNGRHLLVGHNQRFLKTHQEARRLLQEGAVGKLISFETHFTHAGPETWSIDAGKNVWFFDKDKAVFGAMADLGVHKTDLIRYLTGQEIVLSHAFLETLDKKGGDGTPIAVDDYAVCYYRLEQGAVGTMTVGWSNYGREDNSTILYGQEGVMKLYCDEKYSLIIEKKDGTCVSHEIDRIQTNAGQSKSGVIDEFIECISEDRESIISGREALASMEAVFSAIENADTMGLAGKRRELR